MKFHLVLLYCSILAIKAVNGYFTLSFLIYHYINYNGLLANGDCCDCSERTLSGCVITTCDPCETVLELCIRNGSIPHNQHGHCFTNILSLGVVGGDEIYLPEHFLTAKFNFAIPKSGLQVYFRVEDFDSETSQQLIDKIIIDIPPNNTAADLAFNYGIFHKAQLTLVYSLYCNQHYYGSDCSVNCIPHNDNTNGHYTCNNITGAIICRDGWQNPKNNCREIDCHLICDSTGGQCINGSCVCNTGWSGDTCNMPQCAIGCNPQGGYCTVPNECLCYQNWNGTNCSEPLCAVNCSSIGGICPTVDNCTCLQGYTGDSCEIDLYPCDHQMPCLNEANCSHTDDIGGYNCSCSIGYTGENCETDIDECSMEPCLNNGTCLNDVPGSFICICDIGWTGEICEYVIDYCDSNPCMNNGSCLNLTNGHYCHCPIQYEGINCELTVDVCVPNPCQNNATCTNHYTDYTCTCTEDYTGNNCETKIKFTTETSIELIGGFIGGFFAALVLFIVPALVILLIIMKNKFKRGKSGKRLDKEDLGAVEVKVRSSNSQNKPQDNSTEITDNDDTQFQPSSVLKDMENNLYSDLRSNTHSITIECPQPYEPVSPLPTVNPNWKYGQHYEPVTVSTEISDTSNEERSTAFSLKTISNSVYEDSLKVKTFKDRLTTTPKYELVAAIDQTETYSPVHNYEEVF